MPGTSGEQMKKADSICRECGQVIPGGGARRLCDACKKKHAAQNARRQRIARAIGWMNTPQRCEQCGAEFFGKGKCRFCQACRNQARGEAHRKASKRANWVVGRARKGLDNKPDEKIVGEAGTSSRREDRGPAGRARLRDPLDGAVLRDGTQRNERAGTSPREDGGSDDGVLVLAPCGQQRVQRRPPTPPPKGTRPGSMADVQYRIDAENYERWLRGERPISYGYYVAYLEGRIPLKK